MRDHYSVVDLIPGRKLGFGGNRCLGAYVLDGRFVGYFARLSEDSHVSHDALCVPVFVAR